MELLKGKKSYIIAVALGLVVALHAAGVLSDEAYQLLLGLLGAGGVAAIRSALPK